MIVLEGFGTPCFQTDGPNGGVLRVHPKELVIIHFLSSHGEFFLPTFAQKWMVSFICNFYRFMAFYGLLFTTLMFQKVFSFEICQVPWVLTGVGRVSMGLDDFQ